MRQYHTTDDLLLLNLKISLDFGLRYKKAYRDRKSRATLFVSPRKAGKLFCYSFCQGRGEVSHNVTEFVSIFAYQYTVPKKKKKNI